LPSIRRAARTATPCSGRFSRLWLGPRPCEAEREGAMSPSRYGRIRGPGAPNYLGRTRPRPGRARSGRDPLHPDTRPRFPQLPLPDTPARSAFFSSVCGSVTVTTPFLRTHLAVPSGHHGRERWVGASSLLQDLARGVSSDLQIRLRAESALERAPGLGCRPIFASVGNTLGQRHALGPGRLVGGGFASMSRPNMQSGKPASLEPPDHVGHCRHTAQPAAATPWPWATARIARARRTRSTRSPVRQTICSSAARSSALSARSDFFQWCC
jgi:hypothetical protein